MADLVREPTIYLIPECDTSDEVDEVLRELCDEIFEEQLAGWYSDQSMWPRDRSLAAFSETEVSLLFPSGSIISIIPCWLISAMNPYDTTDGCCRSAAQQPRDLVLANDRQLRSSRRPWQIGRNERSQITRHQDETLVVKDVVNSGPSPIILSNQDKRVEDHGLVLTETFRPPGLVLPPHFHEHANIALTIEGFFTETVGTEPYDVNPSSAIFRPAGEKHSNRYGKTAARCLIIEVGAQRLGEIRPREASTAPLMLKED